MTIQRPPHTLWISVRLIPYVIMSAAILVLGVAAGPARAATSSDVSAAKSTPSADRIADALDKGHVYIAPGVADALGTESMTRAADKARGLEYPVYIIAIRAADEPDGSDLLKSVHRAFDKKGLYILVPAGGIVTFAVEDLDKFEEIHDQAQNWRAETPSGTPAATSLNKFLDLLANPEEVSSSDSERRIGPESSVDNDGPIGVGEIIGYGSLGLIAVLAVIAVLVARRHRRKYRMPNRILSAVRNSQRTELRKEISDDTLGISAKLQQLHVSSLPASAADQVRHGLDAYDLAGKIVDDPSSGPVDLAGAMVLLRIAERDLFAADATSKGEGPRKLSAVNPLHGEATTSAEFTASGGRGVRIPVTKDEAADLKAGRTPAWLNDGDAPYVTRESVWARTLFGTTGVDLVDAVTREVATRRGSPPRA